jgi:hypothetical protein
MALNAMVSKTKSVLTSIPANINHNLTAKTGCPAQEPTANLYIQPQIKNPLHIKKILIILEETDNNNNGRRRSLISRD